MYAGDGASIRITVKDQTTQEVVDVSGSQAAQIRVNRSDSDPLETFDINDFDAVNGVLLLSLTADQTTNLGSNFKGVWDLQWTPPGGQPMTLVQGKITCTLDVTRS